MANFKACWELLLQNAVVWNTIKTEFEEEFKQVRVANELNDEDVWIDEDFWELLAGG